MIDEHLAIIKEKKYDLHSFLQEYWNHPHRLAEISLSGTLTQIEDDRLKTGAGTSAMVDTLVFTGSLFPKITRKFYDNEPFKSFDGPDPAKGEITISQNCIYPWRMISNAGHPNDDVTVGTFTRQGFTRTTTSSPWVFRGSSTYDLTGNFECSPINGGDIVSGGRGADIESSKAEINFNISVIGIYETVKRFPWVDPWASDTDVFADWLDDWIANGNATYGGGFSGSSSMSLDFS